MNIVLDELKTRASFLHKKLHHADPVALELARVLSRKAHWTLPAEWQHKHCLNLIALQNGFQDWNHAHQVFSGLAKPGDDMGDFWYRDWSFTNHWFLEYTEAKQYLNADPTVYLLPYRTQYFAVASDYLDALNLLPHDPDWKKINRNLCDAYGTPFWLTLARRCLD